MQNFKMVAPPRAASLGAVVVLTLSVTLSSTQGVGNITQTPAYTAGEGGYYCFRIPALIFTGKGTLLAFAEGRGQHTRSCDDHGDVHIVVKRSSDLGRTWSNLTIVYEETGHTIGNAAPVLDQSSGTIVLVFCRDNEQVFTLQSSDDGLTWHDLQNITAIAREPQWRFTGSGPPGGVQLPSGRLIVCMYASVPGSYVIHSDDGGKSWNCSQPIGGTGSGECQVAVMNIESDSPILVMAARSNAGRYISYSKDSGETWFNTSIDRSLSPQTPCESSIVSMVYEGAYLNTHLYLTAPHSILRDKMTLFSSSDGGYDWGTGQLVIWSGPSGYSSLAHDKQQLYCLYERGDVGKEYWSTLTLAIMSPLV